MGINWKGNVVKVEDTPPDAPEEAVKACWSMLRKQQDTLEALERRFIRVETKVHLIGEGMNLDMRAPEERGR